LSYFSSLNIDAAGIIYLNNYFGQIYKSNDGGNSRNICNQPYPLHDYFNYLTVTKDGYLWTTATEIPKGLRCSRDGGSTWSADTAGLMPNELIGDIFRLNSGEILFQSLNWNLYKSIDDGKTWQTITCPLHPTKLYVTENDEIIIFNQENGGISIYKSTDIGQSYRKVYGIIPESWLWPWKKTIQQKGDYYFMVIPGYGIIKTKDFENFETFWRNTNIIYLFQTHEGVLIAKDFSNDKVYYYQE
jgi:hypothetical protein